MNKSEFLKRYWRYYLIIEEDFLKTARYVELEEDNFNTYSNEYVKQLQAICSEIDVIFKEISGISLAERSDISKYADKILGENSYFKDIRDKVINLKDSGINIIPFNGWDKNRPSKSLSWWNDYNFVKHNRIDNFNKANLRNTLYSLSALYLLEKYLLKKICEQEQNDIDVPDKDSELFRILDWKTKTIAHDGIYFVDKTK